MPCPPRDNHMSPLLKTLSCLVALLGVNIYISLELFVTEYTRHMNSIEGAYIAIARFLLDYDWTLTWYPFWNGGGPFQNAYPPLLPFMVAGGAEVTGWSPALSYHAVTAAAYCLGPVTLFWLAYDLSGRRWAAFITGVLYSVFSPSALLFADIAADMGSPWAAQRFHALVHYGAGPLITALMLLPVAIILLRRALANATPMTVFLAGLSFAAVALTNWLGAITLGIAAGVYLLVDAERGAERGQLRRWPTAIGIVALAYALAAPWIPPSTIAAMLRNAHTVNAADALTAWNVLYFALVVAVLVGLERVLRHRYAPAYLRFAASFGLVMALLVFLSKWGVVRLLPYADRYHLQLEMAVCLLLGIAGERLLRGLPGGGQVAVLAVCLVLVSMQTRTYRRYTRELIRPIDITTTVEYQMADWLAANAQDLRVMMPGSAYLWLNAFADVPQLQGGFLNGMANPLLPAIPYGINAHPNSVESTVLWLRAFGVHFFGVGGPNAREYYKPVKDPAQYAGVLPEVWRDGDDVIYSVPHRSMSLARVIRPEDRVATWPIHGLDVEPVVPFVEALENAELPTADFRWLSPDQAVIEADLRPEHLLAVQVTYHPGWKATVDGWPCRIEQSKLGLMLIEPRCTGPCTVELQYDGGIEMALARATRGVALLGVFVWFVLDLRKRRHG